MTQKPTREIDVNVVDILMCIYYARFYDVVLGCGVGLSLIYLIVRRSIDTCCRIRV